MHRLCGYVKKIPINSMKSNGVKTPTEKKKKPMVSRICQEDTEEETNGVKNLPRRTTARRNQWHQESAEKTLKKKQIASRICGEELQQEEINGVKNPTRRHSTARRNKMASRIRQ